MSNTNRSLKSRIGGHLVALLFCVGLPAFVTAIAPVSWVRFQRHGETVSANVQVCLFFVVPYRNMAVAPVIGVDDRFVEGKLEPRDAGKSSAQRHRSEDEGFLVIHGEGQSVEAPVSPVNLPRVVQRAQEFLSNSQASDLRMIVVANWKFSVIAGGLLSLLTVLYGAGLILLLFRGIQSLVRFGLAKDGLSA